MRTCSVGLSLLLAAVIGCATRTGAQSGTGGRSAEASPFSHLTDEKQEATPPKGKVLFSRTAEAGVFADAPKALDTAINPKVTAEERESIVVTVADLDLHLRPSAAGLTARARITLRNGGTAALKRLVLQISSSLRWESAAAMGPDGTLLALALERETVETDVDHTGFASEAVMTLAQPLEPGASTLLILVYSGTIAHTSARLDRIGAPADQSRLVDWDEIAPEMTALRGFGEVLWYPVSASPVFLGDGARFFEAVGAARIKEQKTVMSLRLAVEYVGEAPHTAYFCGRLERLTAHSENQDVPVEESPGIATAVFAGETLGFRTPSLFVTGPPETVEESGLLTAVTDGDAQKNYAAAAEMVRPLLASWYGTAGPRTPLHLIDHRGQPFEDGGVLVTEMNLVQPTMLAPRMAEALSRVWLPARTPWIDEGLAQFSYLLWTEQTSGRAAAIEQMQRDSIPLALAEPQPGSNEGRNLLEARDDVYYRTKAAMVFWMLRSIVGDDGLKVALGRLRAGSMQSENETTLLQRVLEQHAGMSLAWFFDDWVYADKGLPDLTITRISPRPLAAKGGKSTGWLVAVEVRNDGDAVAEVPVTVRSGMLTATERLRVMGRTSASVRILFEKAPEEVQVNDGSVPEARSSIHTRRITIEPQ